MNNTKPPYDWHILDQGKGYAIVRTADNQTIEAEYFRSKSAAQKQVKLRIAQLNREAIKEAA